jgi:hypothetical protein
MPNKTIPIASAELNQQNIESKATKEVINEIKTVI